MVKLRSIQAAKPFDPYRSFGCLQREFFFNNLTHRLSFSVLVRESGVEGVPITGPSGFRSCMEHSMLDLWSAARS